MPINIEHPGTLAFVALLCSPALIPLARFFFDDFETFLRDIDYREHDDIWWKTIRVVWLTNPVFVFKAMGFVGSFSILVGLAYISVLRVLY